MEQQLEDIDWAAIERDYIIPAGPLGRVHLFVDGSSLVTIKTIRDEPLALGPWQLVLEQEIELADDGLWHWGFANVRCMHIDGSGEAVDVNPIIQADLRQKLFEAFMLFQCEHPGALVAVDALTAHERVMAAQREVADQVELAARAGRDAAEAQTELEEALAERRKITERMLDQ